MRSAVFLDRDDTLIATSAVTASDAVPGDLYDPARVALLPGALDAARRLVDAGFVLVVYSSQGGIARGSGTVRDCEAVNAALRRLLTDQAGKAMLGPCYFCPFHPGGTVAPFAREHAWRKPAGGMITAASQELGIDLGRSWAVGDKPRDTEAAVAAGIDPARVLLLGSAGLPDLSAAAELIARAAAARG